jgi:Flp pilus assembly protein TadG
MRGNIWLGKGKATSMNNRTRLRRGVNGTERGQALVIFAGGMIAFLLVLGLAIDGGNAFLQRRDSQNVSDLASMAGTTAIVTFYVKDGGTAAAAASDGPKVFTAITNSVAANGCQASGGRPCNWTAQYVSGTLAPLGSVTSGGAIPSGAQGVVVNATSTPSTYFLGVVGRSTWSIGTTATAMSASGTKTVEGGQLLPIGVDPPNLNFNIGQIYNITDGDNGPGNFGWLSWTGSNASGTLETSLCTPNNPPMTFPVIIPGEPGKHNKSGVRDCLQGWVGSGATVLLPIWDTCGTDAEASNGKCNGNPASYHVTGLAAFVLTSFDQPAIDQITGKFVGYYTLPSIDSNYGPPPCQYGVGGCTSTTAFIGLVR